MPKRLGTYYIADAARFADSLVSEIAAKDKLIDAHKANQDAPGETLVVHVPQGACSSTQLVEVEKTVQTDWTP